MKMKIGDTEYEDGLVYVKEAGSFNNRLIVEKYTKSQLRTKEQNGFALIEQKLNLKGLKVLANAYLSNNVLVPKGSIAYIKEEVLHTAPWAQKPLESSAIEGQFLIIDMTYVELIVPPGA
jgi:hypothetical protein